MNATKSAVIGVLILAGIVGIAVYSRRSQEPAPTPSVSASPSVVVSPSASPSPSKSPTPTASVVTTIKNNMHEITIRTNLGDIVFQTYDADAPKAAGNFVTLARKGFYKDVIFHRVIKGFMIQGGDPTGTGSGGPGYSFEDELNATTDSYKKGYVRGTVAMANAGPNTNGSQFFIMHQDYNLPHNYTIFGHVVRGQDIVDAIATTPTNPDDAPVTKVVMKSVTVKDLK